MTTFPNSPSPGDQVVFNETTFEWDGSRWVALGSISVGPAGPTGPTGPVGDYVETFNGLTGTVDTSSLTLHVAGISSDGGITVDGNSTFYANDLTVTSSSGDVTFTLEADSDNDTETDNPVIVLKQDGGVIQPKIGVGGSSSTFTDQKDNGLFLNHSSGGSSNMWIQLATNYTARLTVDGSGNVGIGNATPTRMLDVAELAKFDGGITLGSGITFPDGTYQNTAATSITDYVETFNGSTGAVSISSFVSGSTGTTTDSIFYDSASSSFINNTNLQLTPTGIPFLTQFGETIYDWGGVTTGATFEIDLSNGMIQHINIGPTGGTGDGSTKTFSFTGENGSIVENVMLVIRGGAGYTMDFTNVTWNDEAGEPAFGVTSGTWTFVPFTYVPIDGLGWVGGAQMTVIQ